MGPPHFKFSCDNLFEIITRYYSRRPPCGLKLHLKESETMASPPERIEAASPINFVNYIRIWCILVTDYYWVRGCMGYPEYHPLWTGYTGQDGHSQRIGEELDQS